MPGILRWLGGLRQADAINSTLRAHQLATALSQGSTVDLQ